MAEEAKTAEEEKVLSAGEEASVDSPTEAEGREPEAKATLEVESDAAETEGEATPEETKAETVSKEGKKPTRAERRIQQLLDKLKEAKASPEKIQGGQARSAPQANTVSEILGVEGKPPWQQTESVFKPGEEVSLDQIETELNRRAALLAELKAKQAVEQYRQQDRLEKSVEEFTSELEKLTKEVPELNPDSAEYDPELDKRLSDLIVAVNSDEKGQFVPKKKPSEIYEAIRGAMEKAKTKGQVETTAKMAKSMAEAAVSPTASTKKRLSTEKEIQEAMKKGEITAEEAEKLLPKVGYGY